MIDFLNQIRLILVFTLIPLIFLGIIFILLLRKKNKYRKFGIFGIVSIFGIGFIILLINNFINIMSFKEIKNEMNYAEENNSQVLLNGKIPEFEPKEIFNEIRDKDLFSFRNHTSDTKKIEIEIIKHRDTFSISLFRDSGNPNKYWIYNNNHEYELELGSMKSNILENY